MEKSEVDVEMANLTNNDVRQTRYSPTVLCWWVYVALGTGQVI